MKHKPNLADARARRVIATSGRIPLINLTDAELSAWERWFEATSEDAFTDARQKSYFRINRANVHAETLWRNKEIPF